MTSHTSLIFMYPFSLDLVKTNPPDLQSRFPGSECGGGDVSSAEDKEDPQQAAAVETASGNDESNGAMGLLS